MCEKFVKSSLLFYFSCPRWIDRWKLRVVHLGLRVDTGCPGASLFQQKLEQQFRVLQWDFRSAINGVSMQLFWDNDVLNIVLNFTVISELLGKAAYSMIWTHGWTPKAKNCSGKIEYVI